MTPEKKKLYRDVGAGINNPSSSFLNVVSLAPVYFTGAIVTLQPLLRGWQTFVEIRNYGIYGKTDFDEWRERWLR